MAVRTVDVPRQDWMAALNVFNAIHQGTLVSVEILSDALGAQPAVVNLPLVGVTFGPSNGGAIAITVVSAGGESLTHMIQAPQRLSIERSERGADVALAIDSPDGARTLLRFSAAPLPGTVVGISPV
jgi:hypothetical protein